MSWIVHHIKALMLLAGALTSTMLLAAIAPHQALQATVQSLKGTEGNGQGSEADGASGEVVPIGGGHGSIPVTERPDLVASAAGDIAGMTPAHTVLSAGQHTTLSAAQDTNLLAQRHQAWAVKDGISLFTRGEAKNEQRAVKDVGMKLHAASGNVNVQAQSGAFSLTALKAVDACCSIQVKMPPPKPQSPG